MNEVTDLLTGDLTNKENKLLRAAAYRIGVRVVLAAFIMFSFGGFKTFGAPGFVLAGEIDKKIEAAVSPLREQQQSIVNKVSSVEALLRQQLIKSKAGELREAKRKFCKTLPYSSDRNSALGEIDNLQTEFEALAGKPYTLPPCADL